MPHPSTTAILRYFKYNHLPPALQPTARVLCDLAHALVADGHLDGPELTAGLRKLLEAKDCFVRAALPPEALAADAAPAPPTSRL